MSRDAREGTDRELRPRAQRLRAALAWIACAAAGVTVLRYYASGGMQWALASVTALCGG